MIRPFSQSYSPAAANTTRFASNVTGASWTLTATTTGDSMAHQVTVHNDSATNHSGKTILLTGTDSNDQVLTETLTAPGSSATVTSSKFFKTLTSAVPSASIGADTFDIGIAATCRSEFVKPDLVQEVFSVTVGVTVSGTVNYDVIVTLEHADGSAVVFNDANATAQTATKYINVDYPVQGIALDINSHSSPTVTLDVIQAPRA